MVLESLKNRANFWPKSAEKSAEKEPKNLENFRQKVAKKSRKISKNSPENPRKLVGRACIKSPFSDVGSPIPGGKKIRKNVEFLREKPRKKYEKT